MDDLEENLQYYKNACKKATNTLTELGLEIRRVEGQGEKQREQIEHAINQANFLMDNCRDQIEQKKQMQLDMIENLESQQRVIDA